MRDVLAKFSAWFFKQWRFTLAVLVLVLGAGYYSYSQYLPKEGFPSVQFPLTIVNVTAIGADAKDIDKEISKPLSDELGKLSSVDSVQVTSGDNFARVVVSFEQETNPDKGTEQVKAVAKDIDYPSNYDIEYTTVDPSKYLNKYDALVSVYAKNGDSIAQQQKAAEYVAEKLNDLEMVESAKVEELTAKTTNPFTGEKVETQTYFNKTGIQEGGEVKFYPAVTVGVVGTDGADVIGLRDEINNKLDDLSDSEKLEGYGTNIGATFADSIEMQISSLEENLLTGVLAVVVVTLLLIGLRASVVTAVFMISVVLSTMVSFVMIGYSLNTITLFALVLALGLFVDDATIMIEAIDAEREGEKDKKKIVYEAAKKVAMASFAGTLTTVLVFAPLAFISGVLGSFIRVMPVTVVISLFISYVLSLTIVPMLARFTVLRGKPGKRFKFSLVGFEKYLSAKLGQSISWLKTNPKLGKVWASGMILLSLTLVGGAVMLSSHLKFNIFPPSKDSEQIRIEVSYDDTTTLEEADDFADELNKKVKTILGDNLETVVYGGFEQSSNRGATVTLQLKPSDERSEDDASPKLVEELENGLEKLSKESGYTVNVAQIDAGPPSDDFPFSVQIYQKDFDKSKSLATEVAEFLKGKELTKPSGEKVKVTDTKIVYQSTITRIDGQRVIQVLASFDDDEVSSNVTVAKEAVEEQFTNEKLKDENYEKDAFEFDFGQESDNSQSFAALGYIFPIALGMMFVVLAVQFRSLIQPLLIFLAIPFSFLGIVVALLVTDNALSFFSMVGVIGLIGIAVNNTIMLTDYANQERREGKDLVDALANASRERFRPLLTTTLTTAVALVPLAVYDPFWQPLAVVIIGGLVSSTLMVILAFPYYYYIVTRLGQKIKSLFAKKA